MDRPGYVTRCPVCWCVLVATDEYPRDKSGKRLFDTTRRPYDPDWVIADHIQHTHK